MVYILTSLRNVWGKNTVNGKTFNSNNVPRNVESVNTSRSSGRKTYGILAFMDQHI